MYSDKVMEHFMNPRNVGIIAEPDGVGQVGNPVCGDMMTFYIKVRDGRLEDVKFQTFGCGAAIAVSSMVSEMAKGKTLDEAMAITNELVAAELGGLPKNKLHCSNLGADALHAAVNNYRERKGQSAPASTTPAASKHEEHEHPCPYCESELVEGQKIVCRACHTEFVECPNCGAYCRKGDATCRSCGKPLPSGTEAAK